MGENINDQGDTISSELAFDNLTILKEFSNIVNLVGIDEFLDIVPKAKLKRIKWVPMLNCLKQGILDGVVQELSSMWEFENMPEKIEILEKQKEKFSDVTCDNWRPQHNDVRAQLKVSDVANLRKQKMLLESLAMEYETRVNRQKENLTAKRTYLKAMQMDILKYQKKNDDFISKINDKLENHSKIINMISKPIDIDSNNWSQNDLELED